MSASKYLLVILSLVAAISSALAVKCWDCNSAINPKCGDPFDSTFFEMADCNQKRSPGAPHLTGIMCRKIVQKVHDEYRYIRGCGYLQDMTPTERPPETNGQVAEHSAEHCIKRAGTFSVLVQYCSCTGDGCNGSGRAVIGIISLVIPMVVMVLRGKLLL